MAVVKDRLHDEDRFKPVNSWFSDFSLLTISELIGIDVPVIFLRVAFLEMLENRPHPKINPTMLFECTHTSIN